MILLSLVQVLLALSTCVSSREVFYSIEEENQPDYFLGKVAEDASLKDLVSTTDVPDVQYNILYTGNKDANWFTINDKTSALFASKSIDRDVVCKYLTTCVLKFDVIAQSLGSGSFFHKVSISVTVNDINDNAPKFPNPVVQQIVSEASVLGAATPLMGAEDLDSGSNGIQKYRLLPEKVPFNLTAEYYANGRSQLQLIVTGKLDRETKNNYNLLILAEDGGQPAKTGTLTLNIVIGDINDNPPVFERTMYNISIPEDVVPLTRVLRVSATDKDSGENGHVIYRLSDHQADIIHRTFKVEATTGELKVIKNLIEERKANYEIIVEASDNATNPLISQVPVFVTVLDTQNTAPQVILNIFPSGGSSLDMFENSAIGTVLALISVKDPDTGPNGQVECAINDDNFKLKKYDNSAEFNVVLDKALDREKKSVHQVIIRCSDSGSPPLNVTTEFTVHVLDSNDNPPLFTKSVYEMTVTENNPIPINVGQVQAQDADNTKNISYSIENSTIFSRWFDIDKESGAIFLNHSLDRETSPEIELQIRATDNGSPLLTGSAIFKISVADINDNKPIFQSKKLEYWVPEDISVNTMIGSLGVFDYDTGLNGKISLSSSSIGGDNSLPFMFLANGSIFTSGLLNREETDRYRIKLVAYDHGSPSLNSTVNLTIHVQDVNDNTPVIQFPSIDTPFLEIPYTSTENSVIMNIQATDQDEGDNSRVNYILDGDNVTTDIFSLQNSSGQLSLRRDLRISDVGVLNFFIIARDNGKPSREAIRAFGIKISTQSNSAHRLPKEESIKYYAIAIAIGCVTVVLSAIIILAICYVRRRDRQKADTSNGSVTSNSTLETDLSHSEIRMNDRFSKTYIQPSVAKPAWKPREKQVSFQETSKGREKLSRSPQEPEVVSDDVVIWDWAASEAGETFYPNNDLYSSLQRKRQIPNLYSKNQIEWASDSENTQWTPNSDVMI
ncbi:protocadherin-9-like [Saccostrea echinata]|uniref:protocadherin-9-like n=1 Tax=Saccostrea echinata TaxID=191078 RepID=UPI002A8071BF|nr:protocadherin-9-like [Saccostrea echinata]